MLKNKKVNAGLGFLFGTGSLVWSAVATYETYFTDDVTKDVKNIMPLMIVIGAGAGIVCIKKAKDIYKTR